MKTITAFTMLAAGVSGASIILRADTPTPAGQGLQKPSAFPVFGQIKSQGCYSSLGVDLNLMDGVEYPTIGGCAEKTCQAQGFKVAASSAGTQCFCGNKLPPKSALVDDSLCNVPCSGYPFEACGDINGTIFTVYNTGKSVTVEISPDESPKPSSTPPASKDSSAPTAPPATVTKITPETNSPGGGGGSNTAGIAAGVVIGVLAIAGIVGGILFYLRRKRNREIEEEHRRNAAVNSFMNGGKPPGSSGGLSSSDSRIDPVMAQRRSSTGSIADNEDYSRKILRVTNA